MSFIKKFYWVSTAVLVVLFMFDFPRTTSAQTNLIPPLIDLTLKPYPIAMPEGGSVSYDYTVLNKGTVAISNVSLTDNNCASIGFVSGDTNINSRLDVTETWMYRCTTTISRTTTSSATAKGEANGFTDLDVADATVFVGVPLPPPLIHLVKVPDVFVLPAGGGAVTYTYSVTNPGPAPLSNVSVTDDKCTGLSGRVSGHQGDLNQNNILESNETWTFACLTNITQTTTNTGTAEGSASGLTARDVSSVTVAVLAPGLSITGDLVPGLPNTGYPAEESSVLVIVTLIGISLGLLSLYVGRKKLTIYQKN